VPDPEPLARFDEPRADGLLERADVLLSGWGCPPLGEDVLARAPRLRAVIHAAGTVKNHVGEPVFARGIAVTSAVAANAIPVAQYAVAAILFAAKGAFALRERFRTVRAFRIWPRELPGVGALGKTIGIVGASHIGRLVLAHLQPHGFRVLLHDPTLAPGAAEAMGATPAALDDLLRESDVVSLHAPLLPETRHLLDVRRLGLMRDGTTLVNTARGGLVDSRALESELASGRLMAVIDTTEPEILPATSPLYELPNVFLTPHIAGAMGRETQRLADLALDELERFARGEPFRHAITRDAFVRIA
jgi:phosphoglycerate dehydrogenase-like enzyme